MWRKLEGVERVEQGFSPALGPPGSPASASEELCYRRGGSEGFTLEAEARLRGSFSAGPKAGSTQDSLRDEQVLGEGPFLINPLCLAEKAGIRGDLRHFFSRILVAALGPDRLPREE